MAAKTRKNKASLKTMQGAGGRVVARRSKAAAPQAAANGAGIVAWVDDPMSANGLRPRPVPNLAGQPYPTRIVIAGTPPAAQSYPKGSPGLRYWAAAEALRRASDF
jgi:hypothetical protein